MHGHLETSLYCGSSDGQADNQARLSRDRRTLKRAIDHGGTPLLVAGKKWPYRGSTSAPCAPHCMELSYSLRDSTTRLLGAQGKQASSKRSHALRESNSINITNGKLTLKAMAPERGVNAVRLVMVLKSPLPRSHPRMPCLARR